MLIKILTLLFITFFIAGCLNKPQPKHTYTPPKDGLHKSYTADGRLVESITFKDGKRNGETKIYHYDANGKQYLYEKVNYLNGRKNGTEVSYFKNAKISKTSVYKNDLLDGPMISYHPNGTVAFKGNFIHNQLEGKVYRYYDNKQLQSVETYLHSNKQGVAKYYKRDGSLDYSGTWNSSFDFEKNLTKKQKQELALQEKREAKERAQIKVAKAQKSRSQAARLSCSNSFGDSMATLNKKIAIAKGKGSGSALGYMMNHNNTPPASKLAANNYCVNNANILSMDCSSAKAYLSECMRTFGY